MRANVKPPLIRTASKDAELEAVYLKLLKETSPHEKAILRDLGRSVPRKSLCASTRSHLTLRTFPHHEFFTDGHGIGQENLFNVLKAYSLSVLSFALLNLPPDEDVRYDDQVGYCQGLPFVAAVLLLNVRHVFCRFLHHMLTLTRCQMKKHSLCL